MKRFNRKGPRWATLGGFGLSLVIAAGLGFAGVLGCSDTNSRSGRADTSNPDSVRVYNNGGSQQRTGSRYATNSSNRYGATYNNGSNSDPYSSAQTASERMGMGKVSPADKMFLVSLGASDRAEIAAAQLALDKSQNPQVQQYARQMITDHRQADQQLQNLARQKDIDIDAEIPQDARSASYELGKLSGSNFDRQYFAVNHAAHLKTVAAVQHAAQHADDPDIRSLAQQLLPTLQQHTNMAGQNIGHDMNMGMNNNNLNGNMNNSSRDVTSPDYRNAPNMNNPNLNPSNGNSPNNPYRTPSSDGSMNR